MIALVLGCAIIVVGTLVAMIFVLRADTISAVRDLQQQVDLLSHITVSLETKIAALDAKTLPRS